MNYYTSKAQFLVAADVILATSDLLIKENCIIHNDIVYEKLTPPEGEHNWRFFFSEDDYDYLENPELEAELNKLIA